MRTNKANNKDYQWSAIESWQSWAWKFCYRFGYDYTQRYMNKMITKLQFMIHLCHLAWFKVLHSRNFTKWTVIICCMNVISHNAPFMTDCSEDATHIFTIQRSKLKFNTTFSKSYCLKDLVVKWRKGLKFCPNISTSLSRISRSNP